MALIDKRAALREALRIWWVKLIVYFIVPAMSGFFAGHIHRVYGKDMPELLRVFTEEASHYLPIVGLIGIGAIMMHHGLLEMAEHSTPEFSRDVATAIESLGPVLAMCIANKQFITAEMLESALKRPQPLIETEHPDLAQAKKLFEAGHIDESIGIVENFEKRADVVLPEKKKAARLLLQFAVYGTREDQWRKAEPLLVEHGSVEMYALLAYKYWTVRKMSKAIAFAEEALKQAKTKTDLMAIVRAKNNLAYYITDAKDTHREADARQLAEEAMSEIEAILAQGTPAADPILKAKFMTTLGYVLITYAKDMAECLHGLDICSEGVKLGADADLLANRHMVRFSERLNELRRDG